MPVSKIVTARSLAAAALAAGALVGAVTLPASAAVHSQHWSNVEISDVQYDVPGRNHDTNRSLNKEWVEITNNSRHGVNLDGWTLADEDGHTYTFHYYRLAGRATVRVHTGEGRDSRSDLFQDRRHEFLDDHSDTATLRNDHGRFVDDFSWGDRDRDRGDRDHRGGYHGDRDRDYRGGDRDRDHDYRGGDRDRDHRGGYHGDRDHRGYRR
ncbi:lamin tail domain-containing protein [Streptomyces sp. NBC_00203]|uniref:lamin tail domain-containing protein n=1 Tax=Streptomyces sp. NBC_00203 TaxID=2975680 RepID=UPI003245EE92